MIKLDVGTCFLCKDVDFNSIDFLNRIDALHAHDEKIQIGTDFVAIPFGYPLAKTINICESILLVKINIHVFHQYKMLYNDEVCAGITEYTFKQIQENF